MAVSLTHKIFSLFPKKVGQSVRLIGTTAAGVLEAIKSTGSALHNRPISGPQTQSRNRDIEGVTTRQKMEWPSGANITQLAVSCMPSCVAVTAQAGDALDNTIIATVDCTGVNGIMFESTVATATTEYSVDGTNYIAVDGLFTNINLAATAVTDADRGKKVVAITAAAAGPYFIDTTHLKGVRFRNGAAAQSTVRYLITELNDEIYGMIAYDAASDAIADALLTKLDSSTDDTGYIRVPIGQTVDREFTDALSEGALSGGRLDMKSSNASVNLDFFVEAN